MNIRKFTYTFGFLGPFIIIVGTLLTAFVYTGKIGEHYSFLNQFLSELGEVGVSQWPTKSPSHNESRIKYTADTPLNQCCEIDDTNNLCVNRIIMVFCDV
jgi:hypothetical protein